MFDEDDDYVPYVPACPTCGGDGMHLGGLGRLQWFRCRQCGVDFSKVVPDEEVQRDSD